jgi:hypothetical protein
MLVVTGGLDTVINMSSFAMVHFARHPEIQRDLRAHPELFEAAVDEITRIVRKRSVLFVISDFMDQGWERSMSVARGRHDVIPVVVSDKAEESLPPVGLLELEDPETGETFLVDTSDRGVRARFASAASEDRARLQQAFRRMRMDAVEVQTGADFVKPLAEVFRRREARRGR